MLEGSVREWIGMVFASSPRTDEDKTRRNEVVVQSSMVPPNDLARLRDRPY